MVAGSGAYHWTYDQNNNLRTATDDQIGVTDVYTYGNPTQPDQQTGTRTAPGRWPKLIGRMTDAVASFLLAWR